MELTVKNIKTEWEKSFQTTQIIVLIQLFSTICLFIFGWFYASISDNSVSSSAVTLLWGIIVLMIIATFILRRVLFSWRRLLKNSEQNKLYFVLQNNTVVLCMGGVIIAIFGFLIATLSGNRFDILRIGIITLVIFIFNFPRRVVWHKIVSHLEKS